MKYWSEGEQVVIRNIARSDGTVTTAVPSVVLADEDLLALYIPSGVSYKNNWVVPPADRVAALDAVVPSAQRQYRDRMMQNDSIRLYLPGRGYSIGLSFDEHGEFISWYGNLEAPFVRTPIGIDTRDFALDVVAYPNGNWRWKDEAEFTRRLELGIDTAAHQARILTAGKEFIDRFERNEWPFNLGWQEWKRQKQYSIPSLPENWNADFGTYAFL